MTHALAGLLSLLAFAPPPSTVLAAERLHAGQARARSIARGQRHAYLVAAHGRDLLVARISAEGVSPDVRLSAGAGARAEVAVLSGYGEQTLLLRADADGDLSVEVACPGGRRGRYRLLLDVRPPAGADVDRLAAQEALAEARRLRDAGGSETNKPSDALERALHLAEKLGDLGIELEARLGMIEVSQIRGDEIATQRGYEELTARVHGQRLYEGRTLLEWADHRLNRGEFQPALPLIEEGLRLARACRVPLLEAVALQRLGGFYTFVGDDRKGLSYRRQALALVAREGRLQDEGALLQQIGANYLHFGDLHHAPADYRQAMAFQERAAAVFGELGDTLSAANTEHYLGILNRKLGRPERGIAHFERALALKRGRFKPVSVGQTLLGLAVSHQALGQLDRAAEYGREALAEVAKRPSLLAIHWKAPATVAGIERDRGHLEEALRLVDRALSIAEAATAPLPTDSLRNDFSAVTDEVYDIRTDILMRLHEAAPGRGYDRAALQSSERGRARNLRELLRGARVAVPHEIDDVTLAEESRLRTEVSAAAARARPGDASAETGLRALTTEHDALSARMRSQDPRYAALQLPVDEPAPLASLVPAGTVLLEYALGQPRSYLWVVTSEGVASHTLPGEDVIEPLARRLHARLAARNRVRAGATATARASARRRADSDIDAMAARLGRLLLGPVQGLSRYQRVLVVPDGVLHYVPFALLGDPSGGGPLVAGREVLHLPSAAVAAELSARGGRAAAPRAAAVFADPVFDAQDPRLRRTPPVPPAAARMHGPFARLRHTRALAAEIVREAPGSLAAVDFDASREAVTAAALHQYRMIVFATHGTLDSASPELSGVALSMVDAQGRPRDGLLRLHDVFGLKLNAELVVLGACETALGAEVYGEGLVGLSRAFLYAGAARVLASLWKVDEQATVELIRELYHGVERDGLSYPAALRRAQMRLRANPRFSSPFYWAAFVLQGTS